MSDLATPPRIRTTFFLWFSACLAGVAFLGFARTFFLAPLFSVQPLTSLLVVHGLACTSWFALLVWQARMARNGQIRDHRRVGRYGVAIAGAVAVSALAIIATTAFDGKKTGSGLQESIGLFIQSGTLIWFVSLATLAFCNTARPDYHKRYIAMATVAMMAPVFSRITRLFRDGGPPVVDSAFMAVPFVGALAIHDLRTRGKLHPVTGWAGLGYLAYVCVRLPIARSEWWNETAIRALFGG